ncbi:hypothetical protein WICANDRAFT_76965 [Wickerhamomyces anomalus NRRL Y-366-8]|uniref:Regulator of rDNA transcription 14 n=1 Tax=Wickerhamomyces anomalus (strain ATCC 58044 / CBS 1984 / NCYC 433 / NRRL Y-366-8) TaxID=683960 RepID=A0A1E3PBK2_WICAA|nr:uncharacterized protein WICANDRAFT_76965 [Wickerhamomyces anomalus NRRL Y-366-8]ODQ62803.1 hypothetical protein WICANDRAFT_76965 [Wickerhamomyces anomalus NRRL Y-366-8]
MSITFKNPSKSQKTVNKLLSRVLPGHTATSTTPSSSSSNLSSTSQQLTSSHNSNTSHKVLKQQKKKQKQAIKISESQRQKLMAEAQRRVLKEHSTTGKLTPQEALELKKYVKKNVVDITSWHNEDDELDEVQQEILELKQKEPRFRGKRVSNKKSAKKQMDGIYNKKEMIRYPGLTPGLAPVGMDDEDSD